MAADTARPEERPKGRSRPLALALIALGVIAIWVYVALRARSISFTYDETTSYEIFHGHRNFADTPNNHWLNTALMHASQRAFGQSELALRLPNVLAFGFYALGGLALLHRLRSVAAQALGFALLFANPFLLDFFGLARGYGLSLAFGTVCLAALVVPGRRASAWFELVRLLVICASGTLAFYASFASLNLVLPVILAAVVDIAIRVRRQELQVGALPVVAAVSVLAATAAGTVPGVRFAAHLQQAGWFRYFQGHGTFVGDTVGSLVRSSAYTQSLAPDPSWLGAARVAATLAGVAALAYTVVAAFAGRRGDAQRVAIAFAAAVGSAALQFRLRGTPYPVDRTALVYIPLFAALLTFALDDAVSRWSRGGLAVGLVAACFVPLAGADVAVHGGLTRTLLWDDDASSREVVDAVIALERRRGRPPRPWRLVSGFPRNRAPNYYRIRFGLDWLEPVTRVAPSTARADLYWVNSQQVRMLPPHTKLVRFLPRTGTQLRAGPSFAADP